MIMLISNVYKSGEYAKSGVHVLSSLPTFLYCSKALNAPLTARLPTPFYMVTLPLPPPPPPPPPPLAWVVNSLLRKAVATYRGHDGTAPVILWCHKGDPPTERGVGRIQGRKK